MTLCINVFLADFRGEFMFDRELKGIECAGSSREMGRQYGEAAREEIRANCDIWYKQYAPTDEFAENTRRMLARHLPEALDEMRGIAEGAGVEEKLIFAANQFDTFEEMRPSPGCTSMAIAGGKDGPVLGKNNDGASADTVFLIRESNPDKGLPMVQVTYAGWISGLDAMNSEGLVNGHNSVGSIFDRQGDRIDIRLWIYHLMRVCRTSDELLTLLSEAPLTGKGFNIVVADISGDICVIEAAVPLTSYRGRGHEFIYATNHFITPPLADADMRKPGKKIISIYRLGYLDWVSAVSPPKTRNDIAEILRSHQPWAPCRHGEPHESYTLWSIIGLPRERKLLVASGNPCENEYRDFSF